MPGGPLNLNSTNLPRPWSPRESPPSGKIPHVYVQRNNDEFKKPPLPWKNGITYSELVSVDLVIQYANNMRHIVICGLPGSKIFFHIIS